MLSREKPGDILLLHAGTEHTVEALQGLLAALEEKGLQPVPVSKRIFGEKYTFDATGVQHSEAI